MYCEKCGTKMTHYLSFSRIRNVEYYKCSKCGYESKPIPYFVHNVKSKTKKVAKGRER